MSDAQDFRDVYVEYYLRVLAYATSLVGRSTGEDITSEAFTVAWRRWRDVPAARLPWLLGVARNLIRDLRRADARRYELAVAEGRRVSTTGDIAVDVAERTSVLRALADLPDADRELLTLVAWHGLRQQEIARVLHCSAAAVSVRLHRARRRLAQAMAETSAVQANHELTIVQEC